MSAYNNKFNTDNVLIRAVTIGLLNYLNGKLTIINQLSNIEEQVVNIPFFFSNAGEERFMQDYYTQWFVCNPLIADGIYDSIPYGTVQLNSVGINAANITNKFAYGERVIEKDGDLKRYVSTINSVPLQLSYGISIAVATALDSQKVAQSVIEIFWKAKAFRVTYKGFVIPCQIGFSDDIDVVTSKLLEFSYGNEQGQISVPFTIEMETYLPIPDPTTEKFAGTRIEAMNINLDTTPPVNSASTSNGNDSLIIPPEP